MNEKQAKRVRRAIKTRIIHPLGSATAVRALAVLQGLNLTPRDMRRQFAVTLRKMAKKHERAKAREPLLVIP